MFWDWRGLGYTPGMKSRRAGYSDHDREKILARVAAGERLRAVCAGAAMPSCESVTGWARRDPTGFGAALAAAYRLGDRRRRLVCDPVAARAILAGLAEGRRLEDLVRGPEMPSLRTFMAWRREHGWIDEAYGAVMRAREAARLEKMRGRWRAFDPVVAERLYVRLWTRGEALRRVLASDTAFPSLMVLTRWRAENAEFDSQMRFVLGGWRRRRGRQRHLCTPEMTAAIFAAIVQGESLRSLAARADMPSARAMYGWVRTRPDFAAAVAAACRAREHWYLDRAYMIERTATPGTVRATRALAAPLYKQLTRLRKRPGWKAARAAAGRGGF